MKLSLTRLAALEQLAGLITAVSLPHPRRVGLDGIDCAGKTRLADELAALLTSQGHCVIRASLDGFHNSRAVRYGRGSISPLGYYENSFNLNSVLACLLYPLGPSGTRRYKTAVFDHERDTLIETAWQTAVANTILLFDGIFLHRPELLPHWDYTIFVHISFDTALARAIHRDQRLFGSPEQVIQRYESRYFPAQKQYLATSQPTQHANVIWHNDNLQQPTLQIKTT